MLNQTLNQAAPFEQSCLAGGGVVERVMETQPPPLGAKGAPDHSSLARRQGWLPRWIKSIAAVLLLYLLAAYVVVPLAWKRETSAHRALFDAPRITHTVDGIPGDPVNLALEGSEAEVIRGMAASHWFPADPITLRSSLKIAVDSVLRHPDEGGYLLYSVGWNQSDDGGVLGLTRSGGAID
jgi:hypothetical protein